jgi:hypothetical protein
MRARPARLVPDVLRPQKFARRHDNDTVVVALPVTHRPPEDAALAVEIPPAVKQKLGLERS